MSFKIFTKYITSKFIDNISLYVKCTYTIKTYQLIKICPKSFSFPLSQPNSNVSTRDKLTYKIYIVIE
ncbi:hypothetical protein GW17_00045102 [Ensete ventricosum]|nr:hypothetical protein GW17_00045102 [Ensete ventricosum]